MASIDMLSMHTEKMQSFKRFEHHQEEELHVLAVDDSNIDRKVIERLLKISSCKVTAVDSGKRALQLLGLDVDYNKTCSASGGVGALKVNMIITDYWMPGMTGYELLKKIKESSLFKEIPVVIMSSENVLPRINRCLEEGAEDFLVKPVQLSDVKRLRKNLTRDDYCLHQQHQIMADIKDSGISNKRKLNESASDKLTDAASPSSPVSIIPSPESSSPSSTASSPTSTISSISMASPTKSSMIESPSRRFRPTTDEILSLM
ncbi:hypothetical protein MKW94_024704 [Papaver nudicaule]|uniref:Response regulatory domain-containing protein n=1 Tax=Papaver nudicaule TaxID=74823 RepID=A0AA41RSN2_PAPNU|nr:hypothetical protein [Papaver nudicaule]